MPSYGKQNNGAREQHHRQAAKKSTGMYSENLLMDEEIGMEQGAGTSGYTGDLGSLTGAVGGHGGDSNGPSNELYHARIMNDLKNLLDQKFEEKLGPIIERKFTSLMSEMRKDLEQALTQKMELRLQTVKKEIHEEVKREVGNELETTKKEVEFLRNENNKQQKKIARMEGRQLATNIILAGPSIPRVTDGEQTEYIAKKVISDNLNLAAEAHIVRAQRFGVRPTEPGRLDKRPILVEVKHIESKRTLVQEVLKKKPRDFFISELLPEDTNSLFYKLRKIKRETGNIQVLYTKDGVIRARKTKQGKLFEILTENDLSDFLSQAGIQP